MINYSLYSSKSCEWSTPIEFFNNLDSKYNFTLDPCSTDYNHKCSNYFTIKENGLIKSWKGYRVFMNPPYGRDICKWVKKAYDENLKNGTFIVCLLPSRTDTKWFHDYIYNKHEIIFLKGRLKFNDSKNSAPFPSMLVIMK